MTRTIPVPRNALGSYFYFRDFDLDQTPNLRIIGDSGAFSAASSGVKITVADVALWAKLWRHRLAWVAALDVIGDADATRRNWHEAVDVYGVQAVPTIHYGAPPETLDYYAQRGVDLVGLGGLVGRSEKPGLRWLVSVFKYARKHHPDMRFHGWGATRTSWLRLPFYSVDSSSWTGAARYGHMQLRDPRTGKAHTVRMNGRDAYDPVVARMLRDDYGESPRRVAESSGANRDLILRLSALSASVQEQRMRAMHKAVPAPVWPGGSPPEPGPDIHLVYLPTQKSANDIRALSALAAGPRLHLAGTGGEFRILTDLGREAL